MAIISRDLFLVANKHLNVSHRIFCPVQFSIEFFRTGQNISDSFFNYLESLDFFAFSTVIVEPPSYPKVIPLSDPSRSHRQVLVDRGGNRLLRGRYNSDRNASRHFD